MKKTTNYAWKNLLTVAISALTVSSALATNGIWRANAVGNYSDAANGNTNWVSPAGWNPDYYKKDISGNITDIGSDGQADGFDFITYEPGSIGATNTLNIEYWRVYNQLSITIPADNAFIIDANISKFGTITNAGLLKINSGRRFQSESASSFVNTGIIKCYGSIRGTISDNNILEYSSNDPSTFPSSSTYPEPLDITGGTFIQSGEINFYGEGAHTRYITLNDLTATNSGILYIYNVANSSKTTYTALQGSTTFENSGIIRMENASTSSSGGTTFFQVDSTAVLTTTSSSEIYITQINNTTGEYIHDSYMNLDASTTSFTNNGLIEITSLTDSRGTSQLRSSRDFSNNDTITVEGEKSSVIINNSEFVNAADLKIYPGGDVILTNSATLNNDAGTMTFTIGATTNETPVMKIYGNVSLSGTLAIDTADNFDGSDTNRYDIITSTDGSITENTMTFVDLSSDVKLWVYDDGTDDGTVTVGIAPKGTVVLIR